MVANLVSYPLNILAIDTSSTNLGLALMRNSEVLVSITDISGLPHSLKLFSLIEKTLTESDLTISDFDLVAVNNGPGSFTGLRVGLAAANGLAWALGKQLVGINTLDALAYSLGWIDIPVGVLLLASRGEVFWGRRKLQRDFSIVAMEPDRILSLAQAAEILRTDFGNQDMVFIGDGASTLWSELATNQKWKLAPIPSSIATAIANCASKQPLLEGTEKVKAYYIRPSDAEIKSGI